MKRTSKLNEDCKALYKARPRHVTTKNISSACDVSESWLTQWINGDIEEPSVIKVECIHDYLITHGASIV